MDSRRIRATIRFNYTALMIAHILVSPTAMLAQCRTESDNLVAMEEPKLDSSPPFSPPGSSSPAPPLFCVFPHAPTPPPHSGSVNGPGPARGPRVGAWCVAKPAVAATQLQQALDYACGTRAECGPIGPNGPCFEPNTVVAHASYAFNSYFQRSKVLGGTCDFGGAAMLVTKDPSFKGCVFLFT